MEKCLEVIQTTRHGHKCQAPGCSKIIPGRMPAIVLTIKEMIGGYETEIFLYFCDIECYNEYEAKRVIRICEKLP